MREFQHANRKLVTSDEIAAAVLEHAALLANPGEAATLNACALDVAEGESYPQSADQQDVRIPMPDAAPLMKLQDDPQPMIDIMVKMIPDRRSTHRTMLPEDAVAAAKLSQQLGWTQKAR